MVNPTQILPIDQIHKHLLDERDEVKSLTLRTRTSKEKTLIQQEVIKCNFMELKPTTWTIPDYKPLKWKAFKKALSQNTWEAITGTVYFLATTVLMTGVTWLTVFKTSYLQLKNSKLLSQDIKQKTNTYLYSTQIVVIGNLFAWTCLAGVVYNKIMNSHFMKTYHELKNHFTQFTLRRVPSSLAEIELKSLSNSEEEECWMDLVSRDLIQKEEIRSPKILLIGSHPFEITDCLRSMLTRCLDLQRKPNEIVPYPEIIPHPIFRQFLDVKEQEKFLQDVSYFFCIPKPALLALWKLNVSEAEAMEYLIDEGVPSNWETMHEGEQLIIIMALQKALLPHKRIKHFLALLPTEIKKTYFSTFSLEKPPVPTLSPLPNPLDFMEPYEREALLNAMQRSSAQNRLQHILGHIM